ncbi:MAG: 16S rRNA (adenine(1518)-N(6)/adenine(1519)-N(6))-dimethyltransferase RsmA [Acidimicrobiales bacterium]|nr:16S rRNA (adenine(1518)-N(6)/adenine(1519)-N(6))-dimethyltransferase RsmA [Acidimicrobiales bacterium]
MLTRRDVVALLEAHGLAPSRALGQNFVVDPNTIRKVVDLAAVGPGDPVVEIGAGLGSLTTALTEAGAEVTAIEMDRHLVPVLREVLAGTSVRIVEADAREVDWDDLLGGHEHWSLVANLPYNIATPLVADLLDFVPAVDRMLVMVQREAAERLAAPPGGKTYGIPSVKVAYWATAEVVARVSPNVFLPRPNVESALVRIVRRPAPATDADPERLFALVRAGFGQRRKMLRRSLSGLVTPEDFERAGVAPESRAEDLDVLAWGRLAGALAPSS